MKLSKILLALVFAFSLSQILLSCAKDEGPFLKTTNNNNNNNQDTIPEPTVFKDTMSFKTNIVPIFKSNCIQGCHNPTHPKLDLRPQVAYTQLLTAGKSAPYVNVTAPKQSIIYNHLVGIFLPMPKDKPKLQQAQIDSIYTWISQGAINN